jgi:hypothetical protein|tara:strand:+ start:5229 stop:5330 length:102 start_codon:yes stop_codon:yes gene_type:complete
MSSKQTYVFDKKSAADHINSNVLLGDLYDSDDD